MGSAVVQVLNAEHGASLVPLGVVGNAGFTLQSVYLVDRAVYYNYSFFAFICRQQREVDMASNALEGAGAVFLEEHTVPLELGGHEKTFVTI